MMIINVLAVMISAFIGILFGFYIAFGIRGVKCVYLFTAFGILTILFVNFNIYIILYTVTVSSFSTTASCLICKHKLFKRKEK